MADSVLVFLLPLLCLLGTALNGSSSHPQPAIPIVEVGPKEKDKIFKLPAQPEGVNFDQYSGYVTVDDKAGRALFYYLAEAAGAAAGSRSSKPLLLWLTGGPGCSSLIYGTFQEGGPFRVASDGRTLYRNPYAWNKVANVLFLESPAGVGFSYSNTTSDYVQNGDKKTAADSYYFLLSWMERFPEYKGRDFYIAGESYGGHYVPQLAYLILQSQNRSSTNSKTPIINLKGIMIGNAAINNETDTRGVYDYMWTHALISDSAIQAIHNKCDFAAVAAGKPSEECSRELAEANRLVSNMDIYNIYAPLCSASSTVTAIPKYSPIDSPDPCSYLYVRAYLNDPQVQRALHANTTKLNYPWFECSELIFNNWQDSPLSVLPTIREILASNIPVWVYSGDIDGEIPVTSTRYSLNLLNLPIKTPWRAWLLRNEVGGYSMVYEGNLTFATVRGAGHQVPRYQPARTLTLVASFLQGTPLPS